MSPLLVAELFGLPDTATPYAGVIGAAFLVGVYANAAKMSRLLAFSIAIVLLASIVAIAVSFSYDGNVPRIKP